jgi:ribonuclease R
MNKPEEDDLEETTARNNFDGYGEDADSDFEDEAATAAKTAKKKRREELGAIVLNHVLAPEYHPVKPGVIAKQLGLPSEKHQDLKMAIKLLVKRGELAFGPNHAVLKPKPPKPKRQPPAPARETADFPKVAREEEPPPPRQKERTKRQERQREEGAHGGHRSSRASDRELLGTFRRVASGDGYVRPKTAPRGDRSQDILIPRRNTHDAASGDTVRIRLSSRSERGRLAGEVLEIVERDTHQFVGVYSEDSGGSYVSIDGKIFAQPVPVGDPGAKAVMPGDKVVIEMVRFPSHVHPGEGVIIEILGSRGQPGVDTLSIMREFGLPDEFSEEVLDSAREQADKFDETIHHRRDLTAETIITIDPVDARDFDDAISLSRLGNGHWKLGVHIADVAHFVPHKTHLDTEAKDRATSVYLPDRVLPMLPEIISNHLASLQPDRVRYTKSVWIEFTEEGAVVGSEWANAAIKSVRRFTYEEVDEYLADPEAWRSKLTPKVHELLGRMHTLAMILRRRRLDRGAIELTLPEVKIDLDRQGSVKGAHLVENTVSHQMIEEFMLAANEAIARTLNEAKVNFLRRVHEPPDPRKLKQLTNFVKELGIECESLESRFEIKRVVAEVTGRPEEHAVNYAVLRSMQKAVYSPDVAGHYALNSEHYCHFTSPIRRYPDLVVHRMLNALAQGKRPQDEYGQMVLLGDHCSEMEQRAEKAERELKKVKLLNYLADRIGLQMEAIVTGVEKFGLFAMGRELPAEGFIHVSALTDDHYSFDRDTHSLTGFRAGNRFRLGDQLLVEVARVDVDGRELDFKLVKRLKQVKSLEPKRGKKSKKTSRSPRRAGGSAGERGKKGKRRR